MGENFGRMFAAGLAVVAVIIGVVFFVQRGDHIDPKGSVLKVRSVALNEETSLLVLDYRISNDSNVAMNIRELSVSVETADGEQTGTVLSKSDLASSFGYYPLLGEKYNQVLAERDSVPPHSRTDWMVGASFTVPLAQIDARKKVTVKIVDASGAVAELTGK